MARALTDVKSGGEALSRIAAELPSMEGAGNLDLEMDTATLLPIVRSVGQRVTAAHGMIQRSPAAAATLRELLESMDCC